MDPGSDRCVPRTVLVTVFNVAEWSGLLENVWHSCQGMRARGWSVTVACRDGDFANRLRGAGFEVHVVNWDDWRPSAEVLSQTNWEVIHTHPFASRELGVRVAENTGARLVSTFHGNYLDAVSTWAPKADALIAVSRSHAEMLLGVGEVDPVQVHVVPNGVSADTFELQPMQFKEKTMGGNGIVAIASRLDPDKADLIECTRSVVAALRTKPEIKWRVLLLGAGRSAEGFLEELTPSGSVDNVTFEHVGHVESERVKDVLHGAVLAIASGRGAQQSLAVGTPVVAFGSQGVYGLQHGENLRLGVWGNFGGFPLGDREASEITTDVSRLLGDQDLYAKSQLIGRRVTRNLFHQDRADEMLHAIYSL